MGKNILPPPTGPHWTTFARGLDLFTLRLLRTGVFGGDAIGKPSFSGQSPVAARVQESKLHRFNSSLICFLEAPPQKKKVEKKVRFLALISGRKGYVEGGGHTKLGTNLSAGWRRGQT